MSDFGWYFPSTQDGESDGYKDSQLEYFQGNHEHFIAREAIQNAIDARLDNDNPVSVVFQKFQMPVSIFPDHADFKKVLERCLEFNRGEDGEKFLSNALDLMNSDKITTLRIGDYNTCWLTGGDTEKGWHWNRLVKSSWTSSSKGATGWSFGIGKWAPIAASRLRTVFYSTKTKEGVSFQWKTRLTSHLNEEWDDTMRGVGFYSFIQWNRSIRDESNIPGLFRRDQIWTDIFIMGYQNIGNWEYKLAESVIQNFWLPIHTGDLVVTIISDTGAEATISKDTLMAYTQEVGSKNEDFLKQVFPFIQAYSTPDIVFTDNLKQLGKVSLYVKKSDDFPKRVMMARKPKILVKKKEYRSMREPYAAVFLCLNDEWNGILREMEPPTHDSWDENRYDGGRKIWAEINDFIKTNLKSLEEMVDDDAQDITWLDKFLPDSLDEDESFWKSSNRTESSDDAVTDESPREIPKKDSFVLTVIPGKRNKIYDSIHLPSWDGGVWPSYGDGSPIEKHDNLWTGMGDDASDWKSNWLISSDDIWFRSFSQELEWNSRTYQCILNAKANCDWDISIIAVGDDASMPISIVSASDADTGEIYRVSGSLIKGITIESGSVRKIRLRLRGTHRYALTISRHEG